MPGVAVHAQLIEQILAQDFISRPDWANGLEIIVTVLLAALVAVMLLSFGAQFSLIAGVIALVLAIAGSWFAFSHFRLLLDPIYPSLAAITMYIAIERTLRVASDKEKKFVRQAFGQYLAPELLARLESSPKAMELGGEAREITVMFMDVRGFTPISETLSATELVDFINTLLGPLSEAIQSELGTIDKYIGDSIMAFWNAPLDIADHPMHACRAALKMREAVQAAERGRCLRFRRARHLRRRGQDRRRPQLRRRRRRQHGFRNPLQLFGDGRRRERVGPDRVDDQGNRHRSCWSRRRSRTWPRASRCSRLARSCSRASRGRPSCLRWSATRPFRRAPEFAELSRLHGRLLRSLAGARRR